MEIGKTIKALRTQKRVTQEQTAAHLGVSCQAVSKWETGASLPDVTLLPAIAAYFGVTIDELFQMPAEARFEQVENLLADSRYGEAEPYILAMQKIKDDYQAITYLGDVALGRGGREKALRLWDAAVEKSPDAWQAWCSRADRIMKLGMWDQAEADPAASAAMTQDA